MNIAYASDDNFVDVMLVSIMSFNDHNSDATIYILDCGISESNRQKILELCSEKNTVLFIDAKKTLANLDKNLNYDRGSTAAYARLFVGSLLPVDVEDVLYLDCDTLIRGSLKDLVSIDISPYIIGGIKDAFSVLNKKVFGIKKGDIFINSGVLLINLKKWRECCIEEKIYELLGKEKKIFQGDQGIINMVFHGEAKELPLRYDVLTYLYDFSYEEMIFYRKPDNYYKKDDVENAKLEPLIVHFSSSFRSSRPWINAGACRHPFLDEWLSAYSGKAVRNASTKRMVDNKIILFLVRVLHAYLRPLVYMLKRRANI